LISLTHPILLWGLLAAAVPVLIHLLLRPRPRRLRFPALPLLQDVLARGQRASRLENLLLMFLRAVILCLAALLLAAPTCAPSGDQTRSGPVARVVIFDDSLSTTTRLRYDDPLTLREQLRTAAAAALELPVALRAESQLALLRTSNPAADAVLTTPQPELTRRLRTRVPAEHAHPLGVTLNSAARLLAEAPQRHRELVIFTDGTQAAWRDVRPGRLTAIEDLRVQVITPAARPRANFGVVQVTAPQRVWPTSTWVPLRTAIRAEGGGGSVWLVARRGDTVLQRIGPLQLEANRVTSATLQLPPEQPGPHTATVALEPADLFDADQTRHVAWQIVSRPIVWLVAPAQANAADLSTRLLRNLLAPSTLDADRQRLTLVGHTPETLAAAANAGLSATQHPVLIVMLPVARLSQPAEALLERELLAGSTVLLVPSADDPVPTWPGLRRYLSDSFARIDAPTAPVSIVPPRDNATPHAAALREMAAAVVRLRVAFDPLLEEVTVAARYTDNQPAIIRRPVGSGTLVALTTTPDPAWSDLGIRAAGLLTWLHETLHAALGPPDAVANVLAHEQTARGFGALPADSLVRVDHTADTDKPGHWIRVRGGRPADPWPTAQAGTYTIRTGGASERVRYAVNWPVAELDQTPMDEADVVARLGVEQVAFRTTTVAGTDNDESWLGRWQALADMGFVLGVVLLGIFAAEMWLAAGPPRAT
jgi:hypothetical protein